MEAVTASLPGATALTATAPKTIKAATAVAQRFAGHRPRNQPAIASSSQLTSSVANTSAPYACASTHASQIAVPKMGTETACFSTSIHTPGLGIQRVHAGCSVSAT